MKQVIKETEENIKEKKSKINLKTHHQKITGSSGSNQQNGNGNTLINEKITLLKKRLGNTVQLSFEKVASHHEDPSKYPLSTDNKTIERAFHNLLEALPRLKRNKIIDNINKTFKAGASERSNLYGELVNVNFKSAVPIAEQIKSIPVPAEMKITEADADKLMEFLKINSEKPKNGNGQFLSGSINNNKSVPQQAISANNVSFIAENLTCINTDDIRKDEISLAGFAIDALGNTIDIDTFFVGKFKKGETITLNRKLIDLNIPGQLPAVFSIGLFIIESDLISDSDLVIKLRVLMETIAFVLYAAAVAAIVLQLSPLAAVLCLLGVGFIGLKYVFTLMGDDISFLEEDSLTLLNKINIGDSFDRIIKIGKGFSLFSNFDGEYNLTGKWIGAA